MVGKEREGSQNLPTIPNSINKTGIIEGSPQMGNKAAGLPPPPPSSPIREGSRPQGKGHTQRCVFTVK